MKHGEMRKVLIYRGNTVKPRCIVFLGGWKTKMIYRGKQYYRETIINYRQENCNDCIILLIAEKIFD